MKLTRQLSVIFLFPLLLGACSSKKENPPLPTPVPIAATVPVIIGVPECDQYIAKFQLCIEQHVPDLAKIPLKIGMDRAIAEWKKAAKMPQGTSQLGPACILALEGTKKATEKFKCEW